MERQCVIPHGYVLRINMALVYNLHLTVARYVWP